mmetsp:Transcript_8985/g.21514  ORF Transcript_8985/g.21514 Transcript_8985/m.21514 type:complete len:482 (-) Transcript_8985:92-1537(-)
MEPESCGSESDSGSVEWGVESQDSDLKALTGHNGVLLTAGIIVADVVGAGILAMPLAVAKLGLIPGSVILVLLLFANVHISILMWRVRMFCPSCSESTTYTELVRDTFQLAPPCQRRWMVAVTGVCQKSFLFGLLAVYLMSGAKGFGMIMYDLQICLPVWMIVAALALLPFAATARHMGSWQSLIWVNVITLCGTVMIPLVSWAANGVDGIRLPNSRVELVAEPKPAAILSALSTFTFGMTSQFMLMEIMSEMKVPMKMPQAYAAVSAPFQLLMFAIAGIGGYAFMGSKVSGMMNENLAFGLPFQVAAGCMAAHMLISYLIKGVVFCKSIHRVVDREHASANDMSVRSWTGWVAVVLLVLFVCWLLANLVPFFADAVDLLGASVTPISCWLIPCILYLRFYWDYPHLRTGRPWMTLLEWIVIGLEIALALVLTIFGTASAVNQIVEDWHTFGLPFSCHCQGLWKDCTCSGDHVGMADVCPA